MTRYCITCAEPNPLDEALSLAFREDHMVASSYLYAAPQRPRTSVPYHMEIVVIDASSSLGNQCGRNLGIKNRMKCFQCG